MLVIDVSLMSNIFKEFCRAFRSGNVARGIEFKYRLLMTVGGSRVGKDVNWVPVNLRNCNAK